MSAPTNHWKLGLFVVTSVILGLMGIVFLAGQALQKDTVRYVSFFDESVGGLNTGSSVSYRGVHVGNVHDIKIARDRRHVEIIYDMGVDELQRLGLVEKEDKKRLRVPAELRVQLGSNGVTGSKYVSLDFFNPKTHPPPKLPFSVPHNYIPATPSTFKSLELSVMEAVDMLPGIAKSVDKLLAQVHGLVVEVRDQQLPEQLNKTLTDAQAVLAVVHSKVQQVPVTGLSADARAALAHVGTTLNKADGLIAQISSEAGVLGSVQRASDNIGDVAGSASGVVTDVGSTLRDLRDAIDSIRRLADALESDSDMLVKGRARGTP